MRSSKSIVGSKRSAVISWLVLFLLFISSLSNAQNLGDSAQKAYEKQQYKTAIVFYERILANGENSAALYYNLGNAYYKDNQLGKAIYHYELAKKINPTDEDIKNNLRIANSKTIDKIDGKENFLVGAIKSGVFGLFSESGWAWGSILCIACIFLLATCFVLTKNIFYKRVSFWSAAVVLVAFVLFFTIGYANLHNLQKKTQGVVISPVVQVLNAPNESGKSKFSLHEGTRLVVLSTNEEWSSVQLTNGNEGWIKTNELGLF